jgi:predicted nicotinamide N-methyase
VEGDLLGRDDGWETVLAGDIWYERDTAAAVTDWLAALAARGASVLIGDPGRAICRVEKLEAVAPPTRCR